MEYDEYLEEMKNLQCNLIDFIEKQDNDDEEYAYLIKSFEDLQIKDDKNNLSSLFALIINVSNNHHRSSTFFDSIERVFLHFKEEILTYFSNIEIFNFFKSNKRILFFLFQSGFIIPDKSIADMIIELTDFNCENEKEQKADYAFYFYPEIKSFLDDEKIKIFDEKIESLTNDFDCKRRKGENDNYICQLIQNDSVEEFIKHVNKFNIKLSSKIKPSIFETNDFLLNKKCPTLIEYATFYGSIQIIKYLYFNNIDLTPSLWLYSIHSNHPEAIHFLEENHVPFKIFHNKDCLKESIKCHHCNVTNYLMNIFIDDSKKLDELIYYNGIKYSNFSFFPNYIDRVVFNLFCEFKCYSFVQTVVNEKNMQLNILKELKFYTKNNKFDIVSIILKSKGIIDDAFYGCNLIKQIEIPPNATSIGNNSFNGCSALTQICIPSSVTSIGSHAFHGCSSLNIINFETPSSLQLIDNNAFEDCSSLIRILIPSSVTKIGICAFKGCISIIQIVIPSSVKSIEGGAFINCSSLKELTILSPDVKFGFHVFDGCHSLALTNDMSYVPSYLFYGCTTLSNIALPGSINVIKSHAFDGCSSLKEIIIPSSVTSIDNYCFAKCKLLEQIEIPSSVTKIGLFSFSNCTSLKYVVIPNSIKSIGNNAFIGCISLTHVSIPSSIKIIGTNAFPSTTQIIRD